LILVDSRTGSKNYHHLIPNSILTRLEFGDCAFEGNGITVGIEIKKFGDALQCMYSGRLADHQLPGLLRTYDRIYLVIEGIWRPEPESGVLQYYRSFNKNSSDCIPGPGKWLDAASGMKRATYSSFTQWLTTLESASGVKLRSSHSESTTAALITSLYAWYQREDHHSFKVLNETSPIVLSRPTMLRRMIALVPRVGWTRNGILAKRFTVVKFVPNGDKPESWYIENEIAEGTAKKIIEACNGNE